MIISQLIRTTKTSEKRLYDRLAALGSAARPPSGLAHTLAQPAYPVARENGLKWGRARLIKA